MEPNLLVRKWLADGLPSTRVSVAILPAYDEQNDTGFDPQDGPWIVVSVYSGGFNADIPVFEGKIQITVFAGVDEVLAAVIMAGQIRSLIHGQNNVNVSGQGTVLASTENNDGQPGAEQIAGLATSISLYDMILR